MPSPRFLPVRAALAALLAIAQPAMGTLVHCPPAQPASVTACEPTAPAHHHQTPDGDRQHHGSSCVSCCCVPSGVLASTPVDAAALFGPDTLDTAIDQVIPERLPDLRPHFHPFATAPPQAA